MLDWMNAGGGFLFHHSCAGRQIEADDSLPRGPGRPGTGLRSGASFVQLAPAGSPAQPPQRYLRSLVGWEERAGGVICPSGKWFEQTPLEHAGDAHQRSGAGSSRDPAGAYRCSAGRRAGTPAAAARPRPASPYRWSAAQRFLRKPPPPPPVRSWPAGAYRWSADPAGRSRRARPITAGRSVRKRRPAAPRSGEGGVYARARRG
jgi:hypothetical protein